MKSSSVRTAAMAALTVTALTACDGLKEAMTAHVDTVARAGSQELSVDKLATLLGEVKVPPRKDVAMTLANTWIDYQLLGQSAASGDTVVDQKTFDSALWATIANIKAKKYYDVVSATWGAEDPAAAERMYNNGDILAASHILILTKDKSPADKAAAKAKADALRAQVNSANFAEKAKANSDDKQSAIQGGALGLFRKGMMVPQFEQALLALKPGEISPVIETDFGYHIIRRPTYEEVKGELAGAAKQQGRMAAESTFVANLQKGGNLTVKSDAGATARAVLNDPDGHLKDNTSLGSSKAGNFTAARLAEWLTALPPQAVMQQRMQLAAAPDSVIAQVVVKNFMTNDLVLRAADSAKIAPTPQELADLRTGFQRARQEAWTELGVDAKTLADSTKNGSKTDKEAYAARHIDAYLTKLVKGEAQFVNVPTPISHVLREQSKVTLNQAGVDRAVERAGKARAKADSARRASQPQSVVPMGAEPAAPAPAPNAAAPAPAPKH